MIVNSINLIEETANMRRLLPILMVIVTVILVLMQYVVVIANTSLWNNHMLTNTLSRTATVSTSDFSCNKVKVASDTSVMMYVKFTLNVYFFSLKYPWHIKASPTSHSAVLQSFRLMCLDTSSHVSFF